MLIYHIQVKVNVVMTTTLLYLKFGDQRFAHMLYC